MHELSVTQNILDIVLRHAADAGSANGAPTITHIYLVVGQLSGIVDDSVQFYWKLIAKDTPAAGAQLVFRHVPITFRCRDCESSFTLNQQSEFCCPQCGSDEVAITGGDEFYVESIEVT